MRLYDHAVALYEVLENQADEDGMFRGKKVEAFRSVGISQGYYTELFAVLTELGCIEQIQRGTSHTPSVIVLHKPPESDDFRAVYRRHLTNPTPLDSLRQEVETLHRRLPNIDLNSTVIEFDRRLTELEARVGAIEGGT